MKRYDDSLGLMDYPASLKLANDGGMYLTGSISDTDGIFRYPFLIRLDSSLNIIWSKKYDASVNSYFHSLEKSPDNHLFLIGSVQSVVGIPNSGGIYVVKTDSMGNAIWSKSFGGFEGLSSCLTHDNGILITGHSGLAFPGGGHSSVNITKLDSIGNLSWSYSYGFSGVSYGEVGESICETIDHGIVVTGYAQGNLPNPYVVVMKTDSMGNLLWANNYRDTSYVVGDQGMSIISNPDSSIVLCGGAPSYYTWNPFAIKLDFNGNIIWQKTLNDGLNREAYAASVLSLNNRYYFYVKGYISEAASILCTDTAGNCLWEKQFRDPTNTDIGYWYFSLVPYSNSRFVFACGSNINNDDISVGITDTLADLCNNVITVFDDSNYTALKIDAQFSRFNFGPIVTTIPVIVTNLVFNQSVICDDSLIFTNLESVPFDDSYLNIYPNPAGTSLTLQTAGAGTLKISNLMGEEIQVLRIKKDTDEIFNTILDVRSFKPGIYFIRMGNVVRKLIIDR